MVLPHELAWWKRLLGVLGCVAASLFLIASAFHSTALDCAPAAEATWCVYRERYLGVAVDEARFAAPGPDQVRVRRWGKASAFGDLEVRTGTRTLTLGWMSAEEAAAEAAALVEAPGRFHLATHGPRWWLVFLLGTIPLAASFVVRRKLVVPLAAAAPPPQDKRARRAARRRARE